VATQTADLSSATPVFAGSQLDHYRIDALVARSGMASIFRGTDMRDESTVAIKIPHPEMESDSLFLDRFHREAEIGRGMDHPGVRKVMADHDRSRVYMAMEWVDGRLLRQLFARQENLSQERAVRIAVRICEALEYIHGRGVVHRDLKPENVMVDRQDRIKLIDFGLANAAGGRRLTFGKVSELMGTPHYISPEQVDGKRGDARSDIYALGVILYEMLTRQTPFDGPSPLAIMNDRLHNNPVPPREINPQISPQLQEIIYRAMERDPKNRYASAREFAKDLTHQDQVGVASRDELRDWKWRRDPLPKRILFYSGLAAIPVIIFSLLLYVASHV